MRNRRMIRLSEAELRYVLRESIKRVLREASAPSMADALRYIRNNKTWTAKEERKALMLIDRRHCSLEYANYRIYCEINDLLEEYGQENGLQEGWWLDEMSADEVFLSL